MLLNRLDGDAIKYFVATLEKKCVRIQEVVTSIQNMIEKSSEQKAKCEADT